MGGPQRRGTRRLLGGEAGPPRLWSVVFVARHLVIAGLAAGAFLLPEFGDDGTAIAWALVAGVLPYDLALHWHVRRSGRLPPSMPLVYAPVPAVFVWAFPVTWVPALVAALGNTTLFVLTFPLRIAALSLVVSVATLAAAAWRVGPDMAEVGLLGYALVAPGVTAGVAALVTAYRLTEERSRDYVENAIDMIYTHDLDGMAFTEVNEAGLRLTGYSRADIGRVTVADVVAPEHLDEVGRRLERAVDRGADADVTPWELEIVTKDGRRLPVEVNTRVVRRRGRPVAVQGIARDVSERKHVERQRAALDEARAEFIANAAHELRTPLTTIAGLAELVAARRGELDQEELEGALEALARQGRRAQTLADRLLDLSRIEVGFDVTLEPVALRGAVERALEEAPPPEEAHVDVAVPPGLTVLADALQVEQVLCNFLVNAYRYGGPDIEITAARAGGTGEGEGEGEGEMVVVSVADDGPGVAPELVPHVFEPFTRGDHPHRAESTGLGLAISARLVESLGGSITYEPREPTGARFVVTIPAAGTERP